jgi:WD40 repeat protein
MEFVIASNGNIMSGDFAGEIKVWEEISWKCIASVQGHSSTIWKLISLNDEFIASSSRDRIIKIWNGDNVRVICILEGHQNDVIRMTLINKSTFASSSGMDQ